MFYKKLLLQALAMCCWHSLEKTLIFLQSSGILETTFKLMFDNIEELKRDSEIRRVIYGLITLIDENHLLPPVIFHLHL
jgi:hypothetical protein